MRHPRITATAVAVAVAAAVGGVTVASASGSSKPRYPAASNPPLSLSSPRQTPMRSATLQIGTATVGGTPETILEDAKGLPLYTYQPDTPTTSHVTGHLAVLWPPLVAKTPTAAGVAGTLRTLTTANGQQVSYNGHFLYTFVEDRPGRVTGQGVQNFYVATPGLAAESSATTASPAPAPAASNPAASNPPAATGNGYGY